MKTGKSQRRHDGTWKGQRTASVRDRLSRTGLLRRALLVLGVIMAWQPFFLHASEPVHHDLVVTLSPEDSHIRAKDTITLPKGSGNEINVILHADLEPSTRTPGARIEHTGSSSASVPFEMFRVSLPADTNSVTIEYGGVINHPLEAVGKEQSRGFSDTPGLISDEGVFLSGNALWYPRVSDGFETFSLTVRMPAGWVAVSQGARTAFDRKKGSARWEEREPQEEIYLVASKYTEYDRQAGNLQAMVFLRRPDQVLADKYLDATLKYIALYDKLIGPYPYRKFALVENFWETGFGMPSFTLLGPTVIRLPFIINTSYPHEILHNWWGNGVYPRYEKGNWSEGLTAYLADHLLKEQQGGGAEYRMTSLQKYVDYVQSGKDFPLTQFTSRHSPATEAVGYGKALMFFHMLRLELGDRVFIEALRNFYRKNKFRLATFDDLETSFETASGKVLKREFEQWVTKPGAPELRLGETASTREGDHYVLNAKLEQVQPGDAYDLRIPVAVTLEGQERAYQSVVDMKDKQFTISLRLTSRPLRLDIDPEFDVFRRLDRDEVPPAISQALGAKRMLVVLPSAAGKELLDAYDDFAKTLAMSGPDQVDVQMDDAIQGLPTDRAVTVLGWENRFAGQALLTMTGYDLSVKQQKVTINGNAFPESNHSFVLTARNAANKGSAMMFIAVDRAASLAGLGRKLPHYHKYSYLVFEGNEPSIEARGRWPVVDSPLTAFLTGKDLFRARVGMGKLAVREALAAPPRSFSEERMVEMIRYLAGPKLSGREIGTPGIDAAANAIAGKFKQAGLRPGGDNGGFFQTWTDPGSGTTMRNVIAVLPGHRHLLDSESVVVGAHYDHLGLGRSLGRAEDRGKIHPGADDNASGVAVLLELARVLKENLAPDRSIVFVAFTGEEEGMLGSRYYVKNETRYPVQQCIGMVNLDTVGRLGNNKLLVLGSSSAREWAHIFLGAGFVTGVDVEAVSQDLDSSDQKSFSEAGVPAVQLFSGPNLDYHRPTDTPAKIDPAGLVKVAAVAREAIEYLAGREEPLSSSTGTAAVSHDTPKTERAVSLGTLPDYAYSGSGVRLSGVAQGSPAESAGLREGDVLIRINDSPVNSLKDFSDVLKSLKPGDLVSIIYARDGKNHTTRATLKGR